MKRKYIYLSALLILVFSSCNKFLDTKPADFLSPVNYYNNETQLNMALAGVYEILSGPEVYGSAMLGRMGMDADEGYYNINAPQGGVLVNNPQPTDQIVSDFWRKLYEGINRANMLLANINKPAMSEAKRSVIKGEALFLRSYFYFLLVSNFGNVPLKLTESVSADDVNFKQSPAKEVYAQILKDMKEAESLVLPITDIGYGGKISKSAVQGVLARVCLYMTGKPINDTSKWAEVLFWTEKVIGSGIHELNPSFQQVFINYAKDIYDIKESIWEVEFYGTSATDPARKAGKVGYNVTIRSNNAEAGLSTALNWVTASMFRTYTSYHKPVNGVETEYSPDKRRDWSIAPYSYNPTTSDTKVYWSAVYPMPVANALTYRRFSGKWRREYEVAVPKVNDLTSQNFPVLRYSDILLMFAEAENEVNGATPRALDAINQVKRRAYGINPHTPGAIDDKGNPIDEAGLSPLELRTYLRAERARELNFECLRKRDLVRWGIFLETMTLNGIQMRTEWLAGNDALSRYFTNVQLRDELYPIPSYEMGLNKAMIQNTGW